MRRKIHTLLAIVVGILMFPLVVGSVECDTISDISYESNTEDSQTQNFQCTNSINSSSVNLIEGGSASPYYSLDEDVIGQSTTIETTKTFTIDFDETAPVGSYIGLVSFSDGSTPLTFLLEVSQPEEELQTGCQINPSLVSYTQQIQQGTKVPLPKITFNPIDCPGQLILTGSSVSIQGGIVTPEGQKPVFISSVENDGVNVEIDTEGLSAQTYGSKLKISAFSKQFEIPFSIIVTSSASTTGEFDIENLPTCSLTNTILNINSTYSMVCSNLIPDVSIEPLIDSDFIKGTGVDRTDTQFIWEFTPKQFGNTEIKAEFKYLGVPVGDLFEQEVKIQSSSGQTPGTDLVLDFTPTLSNAQSGETILVQILDNKSRSLVQNPELYLNGELIENMTGRSFRVILDAKQNYTFRAVAVGYSDLVKDVGITSQPIEILVEPETGDTGTSFNVKTEINATIFINGESKGKEYTGVLPGGEVIIEAYKEGYLDTTLNMTVTPAITFFTSGEFKKGVVQIFDLNRNSSWEVYYQKSDGSAQDLIVSGEGSRIEFEPVKVGKYIIKANGSQRTYEIPGRNWHTKWWFMAWYWWFLLVGITVIGFYYYKNGKGKSSDSSGVDYGFKGNVGG